MKQLLRILIISGLVSLTGSVYASDAPTRDNVRYAQNEQHQNVAGPQDGYIANLWRQIKSIRAQIRAYFRSQARAQARENRHGQNQNRNGSSHAKQSTVPELDGSVTFLVFGLLSSLVLIGRERKLSYSNE